MKIISLKCNNCSADLEIPEHTNFFNCSFCKSSLGIKRTGNAVFTEVLSEIKTDTNQILELSENILVEKQIARLDRDWEETKASFTTYHNGVPTLPNDSNDHSETPFFLLFLAGLLILILFKSIIFTFFIALIILLAPSTKAGSGSKKYKEVKTEYEQKRKELLKKLDA